MSADHRRIKWILIVVTEMIALLIAGGYLALLRQRSADPTLNSADSTRSYSSARREEASQPDESEIDRPSADREPAAVDTNSLNSPSSDASLNAPVAQPPSPQRADIPQPVVCIDPGHPSETSDGTRGASGLTENHVNWVIALNLRQRLLDEGVQVYMTKETENQRVTNRDRALKANAVHADLFLRLHCDADAGSGTATYFPDRQGRIDGQSGPDTQVIQESDRAARLFHPAMMNELRPYLPDRGIHGDSGTFVGHRQGALTGSIFSKVPTLTVEMCVLTNRHDERLAGSVAGQNLIASGVERGTLSVLGLDRSAVSKNRVREINPRRPSAGRIDSSPNIDRNAIASPEAGTARNRVAPAPTTRFGTARVEEDVKP